MADYRVPLSVDLRRLQQGEILDTGNEDWPKILRRETGLIEFLCKHGIGHPAPASVTFMNRMSGGGYEVHGCDRCCENGMPDIVWRPMLDIVWGSE